MTDTDTRPMKYTVDTARPHTRRAALWLGALALCVGSACAPDTDEVEQSAEPELSASELVTDAGTTGPCVRRPLQVTVTPTVSELQLPGTAATYNIAIQNTDEGACPTNTVVAIEPNRPAGFTVRFSPVSVQLAPRASTRVRLTVTSPTTAAVGVATIPFNVLTTGLPTQSFSVQYRTTCPVDFERELMVIDPLVVDDRVRTTFDSPSDPSSGAWTFGRLMERMAPTPAKAPEMVEKLFASFRENQLINGLNVPGRPNIDDRVLNNWPRIGPDLDLKQSPVRLLAIVNRIDSRNLAQGHAGEGRFIFAVLSSPLPLRPLNERFATQFTIILEYRLPAKTQADVLAWANSWHALGQLPLGSDQFKVALQAMTDRFTARNAEPLRVNGSALSQLRTNEIALGSPWELREFELSSANQGLLTPTTVKLTPHTIFMTAANQRFTDFVNENEAAILSNSFDIPLLYKNQRFLGGSSLNTHTPWRSTSGGIRNLDARHIVSLNTCNGCHGRAETGTEFLHVFPRAFNAKSRLSNFLTGMTVPDPESTADAPRPDFKYNDLKNRADDLRGLVCPSTSPLARSSIPAAFIERGISREH